MFNSDSPPVRHSFFEEGMMMMVMMMIITTTTPPTITTTIITLIKTLWQQDRNDKNGANILGSLSKISFERGNQPFHEVHKEVRYLRTLETRKLRKELSAHV